MESHVVSISSSSGCSSTKPGVAEKNTRILKKVMGHEEHEMVNPKPGFQILSRAKIENLGLGWEENQVKEGGSSLRTRVYTCNFCKKEFSTSQALGGHQNAHKQEREWEKKRKQMESEYPRLAFLHPYFNRSPFSGGSWINSLSYDNHLGSRFDAIFRKPGLYNPTNSIGYGSGHGGGLSLTPRVPPVNNNRILAEKDLFSSDGFPITNEVLPKGLVPRSSQGPSKRLTINGDAYSRNLISSIGENSCTDKDHVDNKEDVQSKHGSSKDWGQDLSL